MAPGLGQSPAPECVLWAILCHALPPLPPAEAGKRQLCMMSHRGAHSFRSPHEAPIKPPSAGPQPTKRCTERGNGEFNGGVSLLLPTLARCNGAPTGMRQSRELAPLGKHPRRRPSPSKCLVGSFHVHVVVLEDCEQITSCTAKGNGNRSCCSLTDIEDVIHLLTNGNRSCCSLLLLTRSCCSLIEVVAH